MIRIGNVVIRSIGIHTHSARLHNVSGPEFSRKVSEPLDGCIHTSSFVASCRSISLLISRNRWQQKSSSAFHAVPGIYSLRAAACREGWLPRVRCTRSVDRPAPLRIPTLLSHPTQAIERSQGEAVAAAAVAAAWLTRPSLHLRPSVLLSLGQSANSQSVSHSDDHRFP